MSSKSFCMNQYQSAVLVFFLSGIMGCGGIPSGLKDTGATLLEECPDNMDISLSDERGAILTSIVVHLTHRETWYFLLKEETTRSKVLMRLEPRYFGINKEGWSSYKSPSRSYCYLIQPGRYQFVKAYFSSGGGKTPVHFYGYDYRQAFQVQVGKVSYIGQLFLEDPQLKGRGYFGHFFSPFLHLGAWFTGATMETQISDIHESDDDVAWLEKNTKTQKTSVVNEVNF